MKLVGFSFNKIVAEKISMERPKNLTINTGIDISTISKADTEISMGKEEILHITFNYKIEYNPKYAQIQFSGEVFLGVDKKISLEILKQWKEKNLSEEFKISLFNIIFRKSNIKALDLEDQIGLPLHIPLPRLSGEKKD
ncbi:MAG: hypothetical protein Q7S56_03885 [Nanoarchaeota archaeon]|nr:hypothetical protein [Nanoarchaeota archaeon]